MFDLQGTRIYFLQVLIKLKKALNEVSKPDFLFYLMSINFFS